MPVELNPSTPGAGFTTDQKEYLQGFTAGIIASGQFPFVGLNGSGQLTADPAAGSPANLAAPIVHETVHGTPITDLCKEERWKHAENPLDAWERLLRHAENDQFPDPENTYRFKFHGLFYVAPAQDSFMLRLRLSACELNAHQLHGLADLARQLGGGYAHITTRGNLQIREFKPRDIIKVLTRVQDLGLTSRGSGADNIRNITASPDSGFAPDELIDVRPFARALHHYILNHRDLYGLPRKFNVAFDNGGSISVAANTNDICFVACRVTERSLVNAGGTRGPDSIEESEQSWDSAVALRAMADKKPAPTRVEPGVYFRVQLGGITGHKDFARDTGLLIKPSEAVAVAAAMIRVFIENGDRTNRKKSRLKYLLDKWGHEKFIAEAQKKLSFPLSRLPLDACERRRPVEKHGWLGVRRQARRGFNSVGIGIPVGRMTPNQMHTLADLATNYGRGELRLTVWGTLILPHIPDAFVESVKRSVARMGFFIQAGAANGGIVACTGNRGCKYSAADTKGHALALFKSLRGKFPELEQPLNLHFTGCSHSCAQHYCGDLGFIAAKLADGSEGYHVVFGGGMDHEQGIGREIFRGVRATEVNALVEKVVAVFVAHRQRGETFVEWSRRHDVGRLQEMLS